MPERMVIICKGALGRTGGVLWDGKNKGKNRTGICGGPPYPKPG